MQKFWPWCVFFLKKFGLSLLNIVGLVVGIFLWALTVYPFNFPYLLHLPADETNMVTMSVFALLFVCIVVVMVRTKWCFETDLFFLQKGEKKRSLILRIVTSKEYLADLIIFALYVLVIDIYAGVSSGAPWYVVAVGTLIMAMAGTLVFAALDCLLYVIARKKADKQLRKREEK